MVPEQVYLICATARQLLAEATGKDWSEVDAEGIASAAPHLEPFIARWDFHTIFPHGLQPIKGQTGSSPTNTLADCPIRQEPHFVHYAGTPVCPWSQEDGTLQIHSESGPVLLTLDSRTKVQRACFSGNETLHILASPENAARYILSDDVYQTLQYYYGIQLVDRHIDSFLDMDPTKAMFCSALAQDANIRKSTLYALAYFAGTILLQDEPLSQDAQAQILARFNEQAAPTIPCEPMPPFWFFLGAEMLFGELPVHWPPKASSVPPIHLMTLGDFSRKNGLSPAAPDADPLP